MTGRGEFETARAWDQVLVPQTNVQLYRLLIELGYAPDSLELVRRVYEFGSRVYSGRYQGCGKPFVAHGLGTAGILAHLGADPELAAAALIHNVYTNGDLGGLHPKERVRAQRVVQGAVGPKVEAYVSRFHSMRPARFSGSVAGLDTLDRDVIILDGAELLEKMYDRGIAYWDVDLNAFLAAAETRADLLEELGVPALAWWLREAAAEVRSERPLETLRNRPGSWVTLPPSARVSPLLSMRRGVWITYRRARNAGRRLIRTSRR